MGLLVLALSAILSVWAVDWSERIFTPSFTNSGVQVTIVAKDEEYLSRNGQSVAAAKFDETGAHIYYDANVFEQLNPLAKFLIMQHEKAHHYLGHTEITKKYRDTGTHQPGSLIFKKEKDADCETGYTMGELALNEPVTRLAIKEAVVSIYRALGYETKTLPPWILSRIDTLHVCYEGELLPRPEVLSATQQ